MLDASTPICFRDLALDQLQREAPPPQMISECLQLLWGSGPAREAVGPRQDQGRGSLGCAKRYITTMLLCATPQHSTVSARMLSTKASMIRRLSSGDTGLSSRFRSVASSASRRFQLGSLVHNRQRSAPPFRFRACQRAGFHVDQVQVLSRVVSSILSPAEQPKHPFLARWSSPSSRARNCSSSFRRRSCSSPLMKCVRGTLQDSPGSRNDSDVGPDDLLTYRP